MSDYLLTCDIDLPDHFPFMGFLSILLLIAIAADGVFVIYDTFERIKAENKDAGLKVKKYIL